MGGCTNINVNRKFKSSAAEMEFVESLLSRLRPHEFVIRTKTKSGWREWNACSFYLPRSVSGTGVTGHAKPHRDE